MAKQSGIWKKIYKHHLFLPLVALSLVMLANLLLNGPSFFSVSINNGVLYGRLIDILNRASELVVLAVGMTLVIASSGGTDISVGSVSCVAGAVIVSFLGSGSTYAVPFVVGVLLAMLTGFVCGAWNGFLVARLKIQPMVATLILFTGGRGIALLITNGQNLYVRVESYKWIGGTLPHIPIPTAIFIAAIVVVVVTLFLRYTATGLYVQSVGINRKAARMVGPNSTLIIFLCYAFCGMCAGIAGIIMTSRIGSIDPNQVGLNYELDAILAVALGGNSLAGGKFKVSGSVIGAITIQALTTTLYALRVTADQLPIYKAIVVILIVSLQSPEFHRYRRNLMRRLMGRKVVQG